MKHTDTVDCPVCVLEEEVIESAAMRITKLYKELVLDTAKALKEAGVEDYEPMVFPAVFTAFSHAIALKCFQDSISGQEASAAISLCELIIKNVEMLITTSGALESKKSLQEVILEAEAAKRAGEIQ